MGQTGASVSARGNAERNAYVVGRLTDALVSLVGERPLDEISVSELCARAGVGRASFYRNFVSKEDVLRRRVDRLLADWGEGLTGDEHRDMAAGYLSELVRSLFAHLDENRVFYGLLAERGLTHLLEDAILGATGFDPNGSREAAYTSAYAAYALYGWVETWFRRGMRDSADELAGMLRAAGL